MEKSRIRKKLVRILDTVPELRDIMLSSEPRITSYNVCYTKLLRFYHGEYDDDYGLVPKLLNAIHISVYAALAFFYFFTKEIKSKIDYLSIVFLFVFVLLLSSKNIILTFIFLIFLYIFFYAKIANRMRLRNASIIVFGIV